MQTVKGVDLVLGKSKDNGLLLLMMCTVIRKCLSFLLALLYPYILEVILGHVL